MHDLLDDYAHSNALRDTSPRLKLLLGLGAILICVASATPIAPLFIAITMSLITVRLAKIPGRFYSTLLLIPFSFSILSAAVVAFRPPLPLKETCCNALEVCLSRALLF